ncbi:MAG: GH32 C-terminal domain-containing protein, partial [Kocuria sp.]|nr:GH32 C-terminal domain-containing protein [Kocuria sp.]
AACVAYDDQIESVGLDRRGSATPDRGIRSAPARATEDGNLKLRVLVDRGSVEVFVNEGEESISSFVFPGAGERRVALTVESGDAAVKELTIRPMSGHWG